VAEERVERRLAAILAADVAGYSRLMGADEIGTLAALKAHRRELIDPKIAEHRGRIVKTTGDGLLVEFGSVVDAVRCAVEVNEAMAKRNADVPEEKRIEFRVGINVGDIIIDEGDIHGDGVNIAARLEGIAQPGGIYLSKAAITERVVGAIQPSILLAEIDRTKRKRPDSLDAYDCVLRALPLVWALDPTSNASALHHLSQAIQIEPRYPLALSLASWCEAQRCVYNWSPDPHKTKHEALRLAQIAGNIANDDPIVLTALCAAHTVIGDLDLALAFIEKALALDPNSSMGWNRSGWVNAFLIRPEISIEHFQRALRLSPFDPMKFNCLFGIGSAHFAAARYEESLSWWRKGMLLRPDLAWPLRPVAACLGQLGRIPEAREAVRRLLAAYPGLTISRVMTVPAIRGDYARRWVEGLRLAGLPE
jgi:class 3 adenylate cyclase